MNFVGEYQIRLDAVDSTNSALKLALEDAQLPEGTLLWTDSQTDGRGQVGTKWESIPGDNFTGTYLFYPNCKSNESFTLSMICALAVKELVEELLDVPQKSVSIKWPNDILVDGEKIAGILIENSVQANLISKSYIGIGLNINQLAFSKFNRPATSLKILTKEGFDIKEVIEKLSIHLQQFYMLFKTMGKDPIKTLYLDALYQNQVWAQYQTSHEETLKIMDVLSNGHLLLENKKGDAISFDLKQLTFLS